MTAIEGRPASAPPRAKAATQRHARDAIRLPERAESREFAAMLARLDSDPPPTFRQSRDGSDEPISFAAMPMVAPASVAIPSGSGHSEVADRGAVLPDVPAKTIGGTGDAARSDPMSQYSSLALPDIAGREMSGVAPATTIPASRVSAAVDVGTQDSNLRAPVPQTSNDAEKAVARPGRAKPSEIRLPPTFDLGGGITVHLAADAARLRVLVRGAPGEAGTRGEITARIVRLMRSHGFAVSEASVEYQGGGGK